jgi:hypothetical protein
MLPEKPIANYCGINGSIGLFENDCKGEGKGKVVPVLN